MKYSIAALMLSVGAQFSAMADVLQLKAGAPQQYVVKKGDTLSTKKLGLLLKLWI